MSDKQRRSLASAHATLMFLALAGLMTLVLFGSGGPPKTAGWLADPALWMQAATLFFLASLAVLELQIAQALRSGAYHRELRGLVGLPALLGNLWVLLVAGAATWRGPISRSLLAELDGQLAVLIMASLLAVGLLVITQRVAREELKANDRETNQMRWNSWCHAAASLLAIFALWYLESRTLGGG
jgi:hypothetical protein